MALVDAYNVNVSNLAQGSYTFSAVATDNRGAVTTSSPVSIKVDAPPTVTLTAPANNAVFVAPASITLTATASDTDGTVAKVDFYQGTTLIGTAPAAPFTFNWTNVAAGTYSLTAVATDNNGAATTSAAVSVTVNSGVAQVYYIYTDQLNTPRVITDQTNKVVWRWDNQDPFGANVPDENPSGLGTFTCNLRFPGQYFDRETNLAYNYFRDYDSGIGRYVQADPLGIAFDINLYAYVKSNPLIFSDSLGLAPGDKTFALPKEFWNWYHRQVKQPGDPDLTKEQAKELFDEWKREGKPGPDTKGKRRFPKGGGRLFTPICIFNIVQEYCAENPGDPACLIVNPSDPNGICKVIPVCI